MLVFGDGPAAPPPPAPAPPQAEPAPAPPSPPAPATVGTGGTVPGPVRPGATAAPALQVGSPRTLAVGAASVTAPRKVSVATLRRARCVNVRVTARTPLRVFVTISSGRQSLRLFGKKEARFAKAGRTTVCVPMPARAKTSRARDGLTLRIRSAGVRRVGLRVGPAMTRQVPIALAP